MKNGLLTFLHELAHRGQERKLFFSERVDVRELHPEMAKEWVIGGFLGPTCREERVVLLSCGSKKLSEMEASQK